MGYSGERVELDHEDMQVGEDRQKAGQSQLTVIHGATLNHELLQAI